MEKIRVGFSSTLSGKYSLQGTNSFNGIKLWESYINSRGGILVESISKRLPVELVYYEDNSNPENIKKIYKKLITEDKVDILLGPYSSSLTLEAAKLSNHYNKTLWNYGGSSDDICGTGFNNIISSITPSSSYFIPYFNLILSIEPEIKNVASA